MVLMGLGLSKIKFFHDSENRILAPDLFKDPTPIYVNDKVLQASTNVNHDATGQEVFSKIGTSSQFKTEYVSQFTSNDPDDVQVLVDFSNYVFDQRGKNENTLYGSYFLY